jgi:hypothetical protein
MVIRLAQHLLKSNRHLREFDVELDDEATCQSVEHELEGRGCVVRRVPFKWRLEVTCPEETANGRAA